MYEAFDFSNVGVIAVMLNGTPRRRRSQSRKGAQSKSRNSETKSRQDRVNRLLTMLRKLESLFYKDVTRRRQFKKAVKPMMRRK